MKLVAYHDNCVAETPAGVRRAASKIGPDNFPLLLAVKRADAAAQSSYLQEEKRKKLDHLEEIYREVKASSQCLTLKDLAVNGQDLIAAGIRPGPAMGEILKSLLELVLEDPQCNTKEYLLTKI